ncbi:rhodopsin, GQ-coupled-like [Oculina patagonica]
MNEDFLIAAECISLPIFLCNLIGNSFVVIVVRRNKKMQCPNTFLLSCLAVGDFIFGIIAETNILLFATGSNFRLQVPYMFYTLVSILILTLLAIERYLAILKPFFYKANVTISLVKKLILAVLAFSSIVTTPGYFVFGGERSDFCASSKSDEALVVGYAGTLLVLSITIPGSVMTLCYARVILHVWFNTEENKATNKALLKSRWKLTKLFMAATLIFIVSWSMSFGRLSSSSFRCSESFKVYEVISILLALLGSMANPILYSFRCPRFRQAVKELFTQKCCKKRCLF